MIENTPHCVVRGPEGGWRVSGTRVSLESVVHAYWTGRLPDAIAADFPSLTLEQVHGTLAFYLRHQKEIDDDLAKTETAWERFLHESAARHGPLRIRGQALLPTSPERST